VTDAIAEIRAYVLEQVRGRLDAVGLGPSDVRDDTDLLGEGILDSLDVLELMAVVGDHYGVEGDWEDYDPEEILVLGPFCRYVERKMGDGSLGQGEAPSRTSA
jgi:acyl carrier protein